MKALAFLWMQIKRAIACLWGKFRLTQTYELLAVIGKILGDGETKAVRLWLALIEYAFASYILWGQGNEDQMQHMLASIPEQPQIGWALLYCIHATSLIVGLLGKYSFWTLLVEGVLGWSLWFVTTVTNTVDQRAIGPSFICLLGMSWLAVRYPRHWIRWGKRDD